MPRSRCGRNFRAIGEASCRGRATRIQRHRRHGSSRRRWPHSEYGRHRLGSRGGRAYRSGIYKGQRALGNNRAGCLGDRRMRGQSPVHAHRLRRLPNHSRQSCRWKSRDDGAPGSVLLIHGPGTGANRAERDRSQGERNCRIDWPKFRWPPTCERVRCPKHVDS